MLHNKEALLEIHYTAERKLPRKIQGRGMNFSKTFGTADFIISCIYFKLTPSNMYLSY